MNHYIKQAKNFLEAAEREFREGKGQERSRKNQGCCREEQFPVRVM